MLSRRVPQTVGLPWSKRLLAAAVAITAVLAAATPAVAGPHQGHSVIVGPSQQVKGFTANELLGEEFRQLLELPVDVNPLAGNGDNCLSAGHRDKVLILFTIPVPGDPAECTIPSGTPIFFSSYFSECSSVEDPPFFGETARDQRTCALNNLREDPVDRILVSIDGADPVNIGLRRYLAVSRQGTVQLPQPNILGATEAEATFVAAAYSALVRPLPPGTHTISVEVVGGPFPGTNRAVVHVKAGHKG